MKTLRQFTPSYLYRKRDRIIPFLCRSFYAPILGVQRRMGLLGHPVTSGDQKIQDLRVRHKGKRCFIVGNGPSLRISDLERLHQLGEICFAFNRIYLAFGETAFRPSYYIVEDPLVAKNTRDDILALEPFQKFFPYQFRSSLKNASNSLFYHLDWTDFYPGKPLFTCNPFDLHWGATVTFTAIQLAIYMGCDPIYLIGVDFFFIESGSRDPIEANVLISDGEQNHFHPDYRGSGEKWYAPRLDHQKRAYEAARAYSSSKGIMIINASRNSRLEVFERRDLDEIIGRS